MKPEQTAGHRCFGGQLNYYHHQSAVNDCDMGFTVFVPDHAPGDKLPVLWWLSGLTCTEDNFTVKGGAYRGAARHGVIIVAPDTSPRGEQVADDAAYDLGQGAGFYLDATRSPWDTNFNMYSYLTRELPALFFAGFPGDESAQGIFGHSMGGHGALTLGLKNPDRYRSISAFAPIVAPTRVPWGRKAFSAYLGDNEGDWVQYDATELVGSTGDRSAFPPILIDQGSGDEWLKKQLKPELFAVACRTAGQKLILREHDGYDHGYFFISSFIDEHLDHHANILI